MDEARILIVSAVAFAPLYSLKELIMQGGSPIVQQTAGTAFDMWQKLAFTMGAGRLFRTSLSEQEVL